MASSIQADTPLTAKITELVQPKLVELGWETGSGDDNALAEYIILMLVNGKTQEQIASELSNDLLSLGPDDPVAPEFSRWLFEQVALLTNQAPPGAAAGSRASVQVGKPIQSITDADEQEHHDADMGEAMDGVSADGTIPTGPRSMRNNTRGGRGGRMLGHLNKAMDRSSDAALHRIKGQGAGRINSHDRGLPKGPRGNSARGGVPSGPARAMGGRGGHPGRGGMGGNFAGASNMGMSAHQQMQLMNLWEQQAQLMSSILSPQQQQQMMAGMGAPAINPAFQQRQPGKSLMERVNKPNGHHGKPQRQDGSSAENGGDTSMDLGGEAKGDLGPDTICKFNLKCTKPDCVFAHQSAAAPPGASIDISDHCSYGAACQNRKCVARHPSPAQKKTHAAETECKFFPNCTNPSCPFQHPTMPLCRNGADCTQEGCHFTHLKTVCKYNPCMNPKCAYKHEEGQRKRTFGDMQWRAADQNEKDHVSERKFVVDAGDEELVTAGAEDDGNTDAGPHGGDVEIAT